MKKAIMIAILISWCGVLAAATQLDDQTKKQFSGEVNPQHLRAIAKTGSEGEELITEPLLDADEGKSEEKTPTPTAMPEKVRRLKKSFSMIEEKGPAAPAASQKLPGQDLVVEQQEITLPTEPIYEDDAENVKNQAPLALTVSLDHNRVHLDESFTLRVDINALNINALGYVRLPKMISFDMINRSQRDTNESIGGRIWHHRTIEYVFLGEQPGLFEIEPVSVSYQGKTYYSKPLKIRVVGTSSGVAYRRRFSGISVAEEKIVPGAPKTRQPDQAGVLFYSEVDHHDVYINQQITLTIGLQYTSEASTSMHYTPPMVSGFITEALPPINREEQISGTKRRLLDRRFRTALFPIRAGTFTIDPGQAVMINKNQQHNYLTEAITIKVKPLPKDRYAFNKKEINHLVGNFSVHAQWSQLQTEVGQPIKLEVTIRGQGNCRAAVPPMVPITNQGRLYLEKTRTILSTKQGNIVGFKSFDYLVVFDQSGPVAIKPVKIRFFNPQQKKWKTAQTKLPEIMVRSQATMMTKPVTATDINIQALQLRPNFSQLTHSEPNPKPLIGHWWFWIIQLFGPVLLIGAIIAQRQYEKSHADQAALRVKRAYRLAKGQLNQLSQWIQAGETKKFYDGLTKVTTDYLAAKFNVPKSYISADRIVDYFDAHQMPKQLVNSFKMALTACEYVRYAAAMLPVRDMRTLLKDSRRAINSFEQVWKAREKKKKVGGHRIIGLIGLLIWLSVGIAWSDQPNLVLVQANSAMEEGNTKNAEAYLKELINRGHIDAAVYFNLGNLYINQGRLGEGILAYQRAKWLMPRHPDITHNLVQAQALVTVKDVDINQPLFIRVMRQVYSVFTGNELAVIAMSLFWLIIAANLCLVFYSRRFAWVKQWNWLAGSLLILFALWSGARYSEADWWQQAVVLTNEAPVVERPYSRADTLLTLPAGLEVTILQQDEPWLKIEIGSEHQGWIKRHHLGLIK